MREFLAQRELEPKFVDVRKAPISPKETIAIVRKHKKALSKIGGKIREIDPKLASDEEIKKLFLGREGTMRAPVVSNGVAIFAGFYEATFDELIR